MIIEPKHPTERYIEGRIAFNEEGAAYYAKHGQRKLAQWSRDEAEKWRQKLKPTNRYCGVCGGGIMHYIHATSSQGESE